MRRGVLWVVYGGLAVVAGMSGVVAGSWLSPPMAAAVGVTAAGITALPVTRVASRIDARVVELELMRTSFYGVRRGRLPRAGDIDDPLALGVHTAEILETEEHPDRVPSYVRRDQDADVQSAVRRGGLVLIVGESTAGKTRIAYEAVRALRPDDALACPTPTTTTESLEAAVRREKRCVVWLDDLERFLDADCVNAPLIARLLERPPGAVLVIATMRTQEYLRYLALAEDLPEEERRQTERSHRELLQTARVIRLERRWSAAERTRAQDHRDDPRIAKALADDRFGVAEALASGPVMLGAWHAAWAPGGHPRAAAVLSVAVDCRRLGVHRPLPDEALAALHGSYLEERGGDRLRPEPFDEAMAWLCAPVHQATGSMLLTVDGGYQAFDYLIEADGRPPAPVGLLSALATHLGFDEAHGVGLAAGRAGRWGEAEAIHRANAARREEVLGSDHPDALASRREVAYAAARLDRWQEALTSYQEVAAAIERVMGKDDPVTLESRYAVCRALGRTGRLRECLEHSTALVNDRIRISGPDHPATLLARHQLGIALGRLGRWEEALVEARKVHQLRAEALGPEHPDTLVSRREVAVALGWLERWDEALDAYHDVAVSRTQTFGLAHPDTLASLDDEAHCLEQLGRHHEAAVLYQRIEAERGRLSDSAD